MPAVLRHLALPHHRPITRVRVSPSQTGNWSLPEANDLPGVSAVVSGIAEGGSVPYGWEHGLRSQTAFCITHRLCGLGGQTLLLGASVSSSVKGHNTSSIALLWGQYLARS